MLALGLVASLALILEEFVLLRPVYSIAQSNTVTKAIETVAFPLQLLGMTVTLVTIGHFWAISLGGVINGLGLLLCMGALGLRYWCRRTLGRFFTIGVVTQRDHAVVQRGPYRFVRHPAYLGMMVYCLGFPLVMCSWLGLVVVSLPAIVTYLSLTVIEDRFLGAELGDPYREYQRHTARLIPGVW